MIITLTENQLKDIIRETLEEFVNGKSNDAETICQKLLEEKKSLISEMAFKRKDYKRKIDNLSAQIIENWCLIRHCAIYGDKNNRKHWGDELKGHLLTVARYNLKGTDSWEDKEQAIREVWNENDYFEPKTIEYVIHNKFRKEGFDTESAEFLQIIDDCINSFNTIIHLVSVGGIPEIYQYVDKL